MAENLIVNGKTYKGAKAVAITNSDGEQKLYYTDAVRSINGATPDANGNVNLATGDGDQTGLSEIVEAAVEAALAEAKESGEFDGPPGKDGVTITDIVTQVNGTTGVETKVIYFSDGRVIKVADGEHGLPGIGVGIRMTMYNHVTRSNHIYFTDGTEIVVADGKDGSAEGAVLYIEQDLTEEQKAQARVNIGASAGGGLTASAIALLIDILQHATYTEDMSSQIASLAEMLREGGSAEGGGFIITDDGEGNVSITAWGSASITDDGNGNVTMIASGDASITDDGNGNVIIA